MMLLFTSSGKSNWIAPSPLGYISNSFLGRVLPSCAIVMLLLLSDPLPFAVVESAEASSSL